MEREVVILAVTRMRSGVCIAGVSVQDPQWMRPVKQFGTLSLGDITYRNGQVMRPFDLVALDLVRPTPQPPHVEDWESDFAYHRPRLVGRLEGGEREAYLRDCLDRAPEQVLREQSRSLCLITVDSLRAFFALDRYSGKFETRITIPEVSNAQGFPVTDRRWDSLGRFLVARLGATLTLDTAALRAELGADKFFLVVGLGRPFQGQCWPLVVGVHTVPDYHFAQEAEQRQSEVKTFATPQPTARPQPPSDRPQSAPVAPEAAPPWADATDLSAIHDALRDLFGHTSFREGQQEVVQNILRGKSTLATMPTGAGKSLCYQLPAMLMPGVTLVISPLISLMKDQVDSLPAKVREQTTLVNSTLDRDELDLRLAEIASGRYKLVYAAPERLRQQPFLHALRKAGLALLVIDEAHCVDLWGHDFRPDYLFVAKAHQALGGPTVLALTATATPEMRHRIVRYLGENLAVIATGFFRPNLHFGVLRVANGEEKMREMLRYCHQIRGSGVVYVNSREKTEKFCHRLRQNGVSAGFYHAGMDSERRQEMQERFMTGQVRVIVATIAFGMGIDKPDVRFILHFDLPKSLESYSQEAGRAGRDGKPSQCILFYSPSDKANLTRWAKEELVKVETLRTVYRVTKKQIGSATGYGIFAPSDLQREMYNAGIQLTEESEVRVAVSLLEQAGLLLRHGDLPRTVSLTLEVLNPGDETVRSFVAAARLRPHQTLPVNALALANQTGFAPEDLERNLLDWQDRGFLSYHGSGREMLLQLLSPPGDIAPTVNKLLASMEGAQQTRLKQMVDYASGKSCRQLHLSRHFGDELERPCGVCDICRPVRGSTSHGTVMPEPNRPPGQSTQQPRPPAETVFACLKNMPYAVGKSGLINVLRGSVDSAPSAQRCPQFGELAHLSKARAAALIEYLVEEGYLSYYQEGDYRLLQRTGKQLTVPIEWPEPAIRSSKCSGKQPVRRTADAEQAEPDQVICDRLKIWRRREAERQGVTTFMVISNATILAIASVCPRDKEALAAVRGMGPAKLAQYGDAILTLINRAADH